MGRGDADQGRSVGASPSPPPSAPCVVSCCSRPRDAPLPELSRMGSRQPHKLSNLLFVQGLKSIGHQLTPPGRGRPLQRPTVQAPWGRQATTAPEPLRVQLALTYGEGGPGPSPPVWHKQGYYRVGVPVGLRCLVGHRLGALTSVRGEAKQCQVALSGPGAG